MQVEALRPPAWLFWCGFRKKTALNRKSKPTDLPLAAQLELPLSLGDLFGFSAIHSFATELGNFSKNFLNLADFNHHPFLPAHHRELLPLRPLIFAVTLQALPHF
jgi:hypothetical protein